MNAPQSFKVGQAPWEKAEALQAPPTFKVGQAPWETAPAAEVPAVQAAPESDISKSESALRGVAQGGSLGFADELTGGVEALWEKAKGNPTEFGKLYQVARDESRQNYDASKKANPKSYFAGEVGGSVATALVPGTAIVKGASLANVAAKSALMGAAAGTGYSTADNPVGVAQDAAIGGVGGALFGVGAAKFAKALSKYSAKPPTQEIGPSMPMINEKPNAEQIKAAAKELGVDLTDAQILDDGFLQKLDSLLQQSPTLVGRSQANVVKKGMQAVGGVADDALKGASTETASQVGERVKGALATKIRDEKAPISQLYDRLRESTQNMELSPKSLQAISRNISKMREAKLGNLKGLAKGASDDVLNLKTVDDVKFLRTQLRQEAAGIGASPAQKNLAAQLDRKLKALEESTVLRAAKNFAFQTKDKAAGKEILKLIDERKLADKSYAEFMTKLKDFSGVIKGGKVGSPEAFVQKLEAMPEEELTRRLFAKSNAKGLQFIKEKFPQEAAEVFNLEKAKLLKAHTMNGKINAPALLREVKKYSPEVQEMLFGKEGVKKLNAARTYVESLGSKANPSETTTTAEILSFWGSPVKAAGMTARDLLIKGVLKSANMLDTPAVDAAVRGAQKIKDAGRKPLRALEPFQRRLTVPASQGPGLDRPLYKAPNRPKVGEEEQSPPTKGPNKWADDGLDKVKEHAGSEKFQELKSNPKAKKLFIAASDLKPGSKAMEAIVKKLERV